MFGLIKKAFSGSIASVFKVPDCTKCISLKNQPCITRPILINLNPHIVKACVTTNFWLK